jgi:hypothetical protein
MKTIRNTDANVIDEFIGTNVFVRAVTYHYTGKLVAADDQFLVLEDAAWIADGVRFADMLTKGTLNEVEPYPAGRVLLALGAIVDVCAWAHDLPRAQK